MSVGVVETAIQAVAAALQSISVASGYPQDIRYFTRHPQNLNALGSDKTPAISLSDLPGGGGRGPEATDSQTYRERLRLLVLGLVRIPDNTNPDDFGLATAAEALLSSIKVCLSKDPTFGGVVASGIHDSMLTPPRVQTAGWQRGSAIVGTGLEAVVFYKAGSPP